MYSSEDLKLRKFILHLSLSIAFCLILNTAIAAISVPSIFSDHMVMQRDLANPVWGKADPGEQITVKIAGQTQSVTANETGEWTAVLAPLPAGGPHELIIHGENTLTQKDILVGEVWFCSGQSNMQWPVYRSNNAKVEIASANFPEIRLLTVPQVGSELTLNDFDGQWEVCSPKTVPVFSAISYYFGRRLHNALGVPIGLINNAWGGSTAEAWVPRDVLEKFPRYKSYISYRDRKAADYSDAIHAQIMVDWEQKVAEWVKNGAQGKKPSTPRDPRYHWNRLGRIYNGVLHPTIGYGIRGFIWYQGEANVTRAEDYAHIFPLLIQTFRDQWGQGDFPFYWVQLASYQNETEAPQDHHWAHLRESQTKKLDALPNTGQAVIIDKGEARDIHPRDKQTVANRLARIALARDYDYDYDMSYQSPQFTKMTVKKGSVTLTFDPVSKDGLYTFDTDEVKGFAIAGEDQQYVWAQAKIIDKNKVKVWSDAIPNPTAVRYAWGANPVCNLYDRNGLPVTPFRSDNW
jgi:sialate O-acetylesterase